MSKFINLSEDIAIATENTRSPYAWDAQREALEWLDSHPDQVPGRTITESKVKWMVDRLEVGFHLSDLLTESLQLEIVPDPEPTNAELLKLVLEAFDADGDALYLSEYLDAAGVRAPGVYDDH